MYLFIVTTLLGFLSVHSSFFTKIITKYFNRLSPEDRQLLREHNELQNEQSQLSLSRDFVKYSKLQRKINGINAALKEKGDTQGISFVCNMAITYGFKVFISVVMIFLSVYYRKVPVFIVENKYNLWPFGGIIAFPNDYLNSVSVHFWMICCSSVAQLVKH